MYRFVLRSFDTLPTQKDADTGEIMTIRDDGKFHSYFYTVKYGWNTTDDSAKHALSVEVMKNNNKGWLQKYEISEENWYDQIMTIIEEAQMLQREYEATERNDDKSDALDELVALLDQAKDFAEVFA